MKNKRSESIRTQLLGPLLILLVLQAVVIAGLVFFGGVSIKLKNNEIHILSENTENTRLGLEKETLHHWVVLFNNSDFITSGIQQVLEEERRRSKDIFTDYDLNRKIVDKIMEKSIEMLHLSHATGVFMVLNGPAAKNSPAEMKAGFYVRNSNSGGYLKDNSSLLMERGLPSIAEKYDIPLDSFWELGFQESEDGKASAFYKKPYLMAVQYQAAPADSMKFAYLSSPFRLSPRDMPVITYTIPIILSDGTIVGAYGLEMTLNQLEQILGDDQTNGSFEECWLLGIRNKETKTIIPVAYSGYLYNQYFNEIPRINYVDNEEESISELESSEGTRWYASIRSLDVYGNNSPFEREEWVLAGMARQNDLLSFYNAIRRMLFSSMLVPLVFSLLGAFVIGKIMTEPIRRLVMELRGKSGTRGLSLKRVRIREIDELSETIEQLNWDVERASSKISSILEHANVLIGVFEFEEEADRVFCSRSLFEMLGWGCMEEPYCYIKTEKFKKYMEKTFTGIKIKGDRILQCLEGPEGTRWVEFILDGSKKGTILGVCSDVTADVEEKEKLERERNYDLLTELYNRRAFREQVEAAVKKQKKKLSALIMWDLDNLKYINDTYGHDEGDRYIVLFADCLKLFSERGGIIARYSGDEFVTYLEADDKEEIRKNVRDFMKHIQKFALNTEGGYQFPIRVSGGLSWYPDDALEFETLFNYADFAMYMVKHSVKGIVKEFDLNEYTHNSYMLAGSEELNRMLDRKEVRFAFQPIVTREGTIYGYELLMRPDFANMKGISEVLNLARAQAKLSQMEALTWFAGLKAVMAEIEAGQLGPDVKLFINSIASVCLTENEQAELLELYGELLHRIVIEMTEGEPASHNFMEQKIDIARQWKGQVAVDDFGTGYNSEAILLRMKPDIIKVDINLVKRVNEDRNRQIILNNLLDFAEKNSIIVLAEGVETPEELEFLMNCGVSLFQGYYIARPQMEIRPLDPYIVKRMQEFSGKT
ncbi:EAL domain-containing protein [Lacrimispora saccharolytica]|uniref:Diguanylate cyclase/phosphodiesterase n=1 Tax=Lacrimispora saccharolytica (strain ATCC 35040 / DSM 2544 / NRCC 2533 / WM1) TaxID=610130 RepID=D9R470_LACSW|nr:EAL domain-containing protein [Lacrimispora saccharolytica]ADL04940.1 diguanylate cyclase/phosphodiesterase [[Clostridium] saccharolyticum WM1]QRV20855.1 EAL domain-containing protein [Lacrimispora saccharolytica]